ncbi:hypothetical protein [uncultured Sphingomonas sp.]|uniref:hypothetical protein n=1 Tax=uncultured Sphingomonas sp. TaxID=158754 RepID=UPI0035CA002C
MATALDLGGGGGDIVVTGRRGLAVTNGTGSIYSSAVMATRLQAEAIWSARNAGLSNADPEALIRMATGGDGQGGPAALAGDIVVEGTRKFGAAAANVILDIQEKIDTVYTPFERQVVQYGFAALRGGPIGVVATYGINTAIERLTTIPSVGETINGLATRISETALTIVSDTSIGLENDSTRRDRDTALVIGAAGTLLGITALGKITLNRIGRVGAGRTVLGEANFAQKSFKATFSEEGAFAGRRVSDVAGDIRAGRISPSDVPLDYIVREGKPIILNTRSAQALEQAGVPRGQWNGINRTGNAEFELRLDGQLNRNRLGPQGTPTVRPGSGH